MAESSNLDQALATDSSKLCGWFFLPREVRDEIYSMLTHRIILWPDKGAHIRLEISLIDAPIARLFTLNRQFKKEYEDYFKLGMTIVLRDLWSMVSEPPIIRKWPNKMRILKAEIVGLLVCETDDCDSQSTRCYGIYHDMREHLDAITKTLPRLKDLKALQIRLYPCQEGKIDHEPVDLAAKTFGAFEAMEVTKRIEVYPFFAYQESGDDDDAEKVYNANPVPDAAWTRRDGWQHK